MTDERLRRVSHNELAFRRANERLREDWRRLGMGAQDEGLFLCECADVTCKQPMRMRLADYEAVRVDPATFVVLPGHDDGTVESVVDDVLPASEAFSVVRKHEAPGA